MSSQDVQAAMDADGEQPEFGGEGDESNGMGENVMTQAEDTGGAEQESLDVARLAAEMEAESDEIVQKVGEEAVDGAGGGVDAVQQEIRKSYKQDSYAVVNQLRRRPVEKSRLRIPLCRMEPMRVVRPALLTDIKRLQNAFVYGYRPYSAAMYVAPTNHKGEGLEVSPEIRAKWKRRWQMEDEKFERVLNEDPDLASLSNKMFYVYDGNHRLLAWREFIETEHEDDAVWYSEHGNPECLVLDVSQGRRQVLNAMHDINM